MKLHKTLHFWKRLLIITFFSMAAFASEASYPVVGEDWAFQLDEAKVSLVWISPGEFIMGSPESESGRQGDEIQHSVRFSKGFWMGSTEVTQELWNAMMSKNPSHFANDPQRPVDTVSWEMAMEFCQRLHQRLEREGILLEGWEVSLPTEAQWEYACRAGTQSAYAGNPDRLACYGGNSNEQTQPVASLQPNAWGLFDMHGNLWEWCLDWCADYPSVNVVDPGSPDFGTLRIMRGGAWYQPVRYLRSANRYFARPSYRDSATGFRFVLKQGEDGSVKTAKTMESKGRQ